MRCDHSELLINSARLKCVLAHWQEMRGNQLMPVWQDIRPAAIKAALPYVWSFQYDPAQDEFIGGLAGDEIQRLLKGPIKNFSFRHIHGADMHLIARAKQVLLRPAIFVGRGLLFRKRERQCYGERIMLPFAGRPDRPGGIFGVTDYSFSLLYKTGPERNSEVEHWFDLKVFAGSPPAKPSVPARRVTDTKAIAP
jgi:hypothetical protein